MNLGIGIRRRLYVSEVATVRRPGLPAHSFAVGRDEALILRRYLEEPKVRVVVGIGDEASIRGRYAFEAQHGTVIGERRRRPDAIGWGMGERAETLLPGGRADIAFRLERNRYKGREQLQLLLQDLKPSE